MRSNQLTAIVITTRTVGPAQQSTPLGPGDPTHSGELGPGPLSDTAPYPGKKKLSEGVILAADRRDTT